MIEHVFRADDSDSAMEKAIRELGEDALILSVKRLGDVTEVRAIKESLASASLRNPTSFPKGSRAKPISLSDALRSAESKRQVPTKQTSKSQPPALDFFFGDDPFIAPTAEHEASQKQERLIPEPPEKSSFGFDLPFDEMLTAQAFETRENPSIENYEALSYLEETTHENVFPLQVDESELDTLTSERADMSFPADVETLRAEDATITSAQEPQPFPDNAQILRHNGFSSHIVQKCMTCIELTKLESQVAYACQELAAQLSISKEKPTPLDSDILFVFGPSGSGKTTTVAKLGFTRKIETGTTPNFYKASHASFVDDTRLQGFTQLLDSKIIDEIKDIHVSDGEQVIVDCCLIEASEIIEAYQYLKSKFPFSRIQPILTLPGTWSVLATEHYCSEVAKLQPCTILTHLQIGGLAIAGFSALAANNGMLLAASENDQISDGIEIIDASAIQHFLEETFNYTDSRPYAVL